MNGKNINLRWKEDGRLVKVCPEVGGGMKIPRPPAQIVGGSGLDVLKGKARVMDNEGCDVTGLFIKGAEYALSIAQKIWGYCRLVGSRPIR